MAATARSDLYDGLIRKIGYSVGLEFLVPRVRNVLSIFLLGLLDGAAWRDLVRLEWKRASPSAEQHIADVYAQLDLIRKRGLSIQPLPGLETMAILAAGANPLTGQPVDEGDIVRFVLIQKILEADGDIFLNALASNFVAPDLDARLAAMLKYKRRAVAPHFPQAGSIRRLAEAISIRNQSSDSPGSGSRKMTYAERSRMLMSAKSKEVETDWTNRDVTISGDYLEKACVTRRGWAVELGLFDRAAGRTPHGTALLASLSALGLSFKHEGLRYFAFWPYPYQLARLNLSPADLEARAIDAGDVTDAVTRAIFEVPEFPNRPADRSEILALLREAYARYRATGPRGILRHELPLYVAEPVLAWWFAQSQRGPQDLRAFVRTELRRSDRGLDEVTIRGTEGGLRLMEKTVDDVDN